MKEYKTPTIASINLGKAMINGKEHDVVGVIPFLAAVAGAAAAVASAATAVTGAKQTYKDGYLENNSINTLKKVK